MRYPGRIVVAVTALLILFGGFVMVADAQTRGRHVKRPLVVRHHWHRRPYYSNWRWYDPWYDPYFYDPYLSERRRMFILQSDVRDERRELREDREKYLRDGVLTPKESEKLAKQERKLQSAIDRLRKFRRERGY